MIKTRIILTMCSMLVIFCIGCASFQAEKSLIGSQHFQPAFDNSHAILIEKAVQGLPLIETISGTIDDDEDIVVASIESTTHDDQGISYLVEDSLIFNLSKEGYTVLERDNHILYQMSNEQGEVYNAFALRNYPQHPIYTLLKQLEEKGLDYFSAQDVKDGIEKMDEIENVEALSALKEINRVDLEQMIEFYLSLKEEYSNLVEVVNENSSMKTADVFVSYRLLEAGILVDIEREQIQRETDNFPTKILWRHKYNRNAIARVFFRIIDAKTGEIRTARILENQVTDTIEFQQGDDESEKDYNTRITKYQNLLEDYHFTYYEQQLPNQKANLSQTVSSADTTQTGKETENSDMTGVEEGYDDNYYSFWVECQ